MEKAKYKKYIVTDLHVSKSTPVLDPNYNDWASRILSVDNEVIQGAIHFGCTWWFNTPANQLGIHSHEFDELLAFIGSNYKDRYDLGGEIEFTIEDEKYTLTKTCVIYIPKGIKHSLTIKRVDRPIMHLGVQR